MAKRGTSGIAECRLQPLGPGRVPGLDGAAVIGRAAFPGRVVHGDEPVGSSDMGGADPAADRHEVCGLGALIEDEHRVDIGERPHRLLHAEPVHDVVIEVDPVAGSGVG